RRIDYMILCCVDALLRLLNTRQHRFAARFDFFQPRIPRQQFIAPRRKCVRTPHLAAKCSEEDDNGDREDKGTNREDEGCIYHCFDSHSHVYTPAQTVGSRRSSLFLATTG